MAVTAAPARPVTELSDRVVRRAEVVGVWAVDCVCAHRADTDWATELLGDEEHRLEHATLDDDGYHVDSFAVEPVAHQRGTAYVRLVCAVTVRPARLSPTPRGADAARDPGRADARTRPCACDLRAPNRRRRRSRAVGTRVTAARSPGASDLRPWLPRSLTTVRPGASGGIPNGSLSPCTISTGTVTASSSASRVFSGRPGGCSGNARHSTPAAPSPRRCGTRRARLTSGRRRRAARRAAAARRPRSTPRRAAAPARPTCGRRPGRAVRRARRRRSPPAPPPSPPSGRAR